MSIAEEIKPLVQMYQKPAHPLRLKEWLILQVNSGKYPGLRWEDEQKTRFRIPWKHASKQNYSEEEDAALFKAWAMYKGKFRDGASKADPSVWKTRLRCALNKSPDFQEVSESCQDAGEPFKIYRIVAEPQDTSYDPYREMYRSPVKEGPPSSPEDKLQIVEQKRDGYSDRESPPKVPRLENHQIRKDTDASGEVIVKDPHSDHRMTGMSEQDVMASLSSSSSDFWLHIRLYYQGKLVTEVTTQTAEGCRITSQLSCQWNYGPYSPALLEEIPFPSPQEVVGILTPEVFQVLKKLLRHLEKGVVLWVAPEGVFIKRQCQVRVYWNSPSALHKDQPNKLEREKTCKVMDTEQFMNDLEMFMTRQGPEPQYQIQLCFGEEYPESSGSPNKLITAHVEPVFARELLEKAKMKLRKEPASHNLQSPL
ncbi:interferon regulatory factor 4-like [Mantella aurantiaca]